ncbi:MAG: hypothetical protein KIT87_12970 [Anaerolineae bacterium]|nr:hypothetical protein [Anaerolineae bacterium]
MKRQIAVLVGLLVVFVLSLVALSSPVAVYGSAIPQSFEANAVPRTAALAGDFSARAAVAATGSVGPDFNADGKRDVLWNKSSTGENVMWLVDGFSISYQFVPSVPTGWSVIV